MELLTEIAKTIYFFLPAAFANMVPVMFRNVNFLNYPADFGKKLGKERIFGKNKTLRGFFFGILFAILIVYIQSFFSFFDLTYSKESILFFGFLFGFGALFGDLIKSFIKRRLSIGEGKSLLFFDQIDWVLGSFILVYLFSETSISFLFYAIPTFFILHILVKQISFRIGIEKSKW